MTDVSVKEYIDRLFAAHERATDITHQALDKRLEGMNEFRMQLRDQAQTFVPRAEHDILVRQISELKEAMAESRGKASQTQVGVSYIIAGIGLVIAIISLFHKVGP